MQAMCSDFENQVLSGLKKCGVNLSTVSAAGGAVGAAVSGGADSVSLLVSLCVICKNFSIPLKVITVNHFIRSKEETCGDVEYVSQLCSRLKEQGYELSLKIHEIPKGTIAELSEKKNIGTEAAARELRYAAFEDFIVTEKLYVLCLAHNKNDQLETVLMRFIQGAGCDSLGGIPCRRNKYVRPLLWTDRSAIEAYLKEKGIKWRTDSTNSDNTYLRNRIRNELVPVLNERFTGWDRGVLLGSQKAEEDSKVIKPLVESFISAHAKVDKVSVTLDGPAFYALERSIKIRVLLACANCLGLDMRIPYVFLRDVCDCADNYIEEKSEKKGGGTAVKSFASLQFVLKKDGVLIKKSPEIQNEIVFSDIIEHGGTYEFAWGQIVVPDNLDFPVMVRSWHTGDMVQTADGGSKKVCDVLASWHVAENLRHYIPVVQALNEPEQRILCILGSCQGYKDWIVKK